MTHQDYLKAANYWKEQEIHGAPTEKILNAFENYVKSRNTCALATSSDDDVRCTPIEYLYYKENFWLFSEGGEKFLHLEKNKNVALAIFDQFTGFSQLKGVQIKGHAELIDFTNPLYQEIAAQKGLSLSALEKKKTPLYLIKITPKVIEFTNSDFQKEGFSPKQILLN